MEDEKDEQIIREQLTGVVEEWIREAFQAREDLLDAKQKSHDAEACKLKKEVEQLQLKKIRLSGKLRRASVADLRVYHYLFMGTETPP